MPPVANVSAELVAAKQPAPLKVGGIHRDYARDAVCDRWGRDEEQVRRQLARAAQIADAIGSCIAATPELERGITLGGRQVQRLTVAAAGFRRLVDRDEKILEEFSLYEQLKKAGQLPASEYRGEREAGEAGSAERRTPGPRRGGVSSSPAAGRS